MNRIQFWILIGASSLIVLLLLLQVVFARGAAYSQARNAQAQQILAQGQTCSTRLGQLAGRVYQLSQSTGDQGLKDLLTRQQLTFTPPSHTGETATPASTGTGDTTPSNLPAPKL